MQPTTKGVCLTKDPRTGATAAISCSLLCSTESMLFYCTKNVTQTQAPKIEKLPCPSVWPLCGASFGWRA